MSRGTCLLCFAANVKTYNIKETHLQFGFEEILDFKVQAQTPPHSLCYICHTKFQQFYNFVTQTRNIQMSYNDENVQVEYPPLVQLSTVKVLDTSIPYHSVTIKQEPDVKENSVYINEENVGNKSVNLKYEIKEESSTGSSSSYELTQETSTNIVTDLQQHSIESKTPDFEDEEENNIDKLDGKTSELKNKYKCDICDKEFNRSRYLKSHKHWTHTSEQPYSCDICDKKFKQRGYLKSHKLIHTGEKPYSCDVCDKKFNRMCNLTKHKRLHTREKPYSCDICDKKFSRSDALKAHVRAHDTHYVSHKPYYYCEECDREFIDKSYLNRHMETHR